MIPGLERRAPQPSGLPLVGNYPELRKNPLEFFLRAFRDHGDVVRMRFGWVEAHLLSHPAHAKYVLQEHWQDFSKNTPGFDKLRLVLGNGLLTSEGDFWRRQRRLMQPAFHHARLEGLVEVMVKAAADLGDEWAVAARAGRVVDVAEDMMRLTLRIVAETLLGTDVTRESKDIGPAVTAVLEDVNQRAKQVFDVPQTIPTRQNRKLARALATLDAVVLRAIAEHRQRTPSRPDLLTLLLAVKDEDTGEGMSDRQIRDEVMTIFLAGHETTANALAWTFALLSQHPRFDGEVRDEISSVLRGALPQFSDAARLPRTTMVVKESMRLYPPAWTIGRFAKQPHTFGGFRVDAGNIVFVSPYVIHRHPELWSNPEGFDPDRFTPERESQRPRFAYFPFGGGPRICIGNAFAMLEAQLVLATLLPRFRLELPPGHTPTVQPLVTLRPRGGLPMRVRMRDAIR